MKERERQPSYGERVILCTRQDCAHSGPLVELPRELGDVVPGDRFGICEADCIIMDRRAKFGKPCGVFAKVDPAKRKRVG